jgi:putative membrane-bound dehydrogenase-like protein
MKRLLSMAVLVLLGAALQGQQAPQQSVAAFKAAPGLEVKLWASEPMLLNPTDLTVDERGRIWVLEGVNYRRTQRNLPDPRPEGDRIVILEDTDQDGQADKVKVFDQSPQLRVPLGIAVLGDKVYVSQAPDLIVYTKDADDHIIKKEVLLTGFGGIDHDHGLHAVVFGPDGKYYFNQGNTGFDLTDRSGRHMQTQGTGTNTRPGPGYYEGTVLRMNADGTGVEVIGQNFRNPYEVAVDSFGNVFQTDNDDDGNVWTRLVYNMDGGNYGFRGPLNRTWLEDRGTHWHTELPAVVPVVARLGAGSPCGLLVYEGTLLPSPYRGQLLHAEAGKRIVAMYPLTNDGAGFSARIEDVVNGGQDTWARPTDVAVAPDGAVFITDWYDPGVGGHQMGDPQGARGRVYRLAPAGNRPQVPTVNLTSAAGLGAALGSPNQSTRYLAHTAIAGQKESAVPLLQGLWRQSDPILRARALWLLGGLGRAGSAAVQDALRDQDPKFRVLGLRVAQLNQLSQPDGGDLLPLARPLVHDSSPQVRREIALMLRDRNPALMLPPYVYKDQQQPSAEWLDAMAQLTAQYDGKDRWYLEALGIAARGREEALYARLKSDPATKSSASLARVVWELRPKTALADLVAVVNDGSASSERRMFALDTLGAMQWPEAARAMESFITGPASPPPLVEHAFGLYSHQLFSMWMDARTSPALPQILRKMFAAPGAQAAAVALADVLGDPQYLPDLMALAKSSAAVTEARAAAIEAVAVTRDPKYLPDLQALAENAPTLVRVAAVRAVGGLGQQNLEPWNLAIVLGDAPNEVRTEALRALAGSLPGLVAILDLADQHKVPPELQSLARNLTNTAAPPAPAGRRGAPQSPVAMRARGAVPTDPAYLAIRERASKVLPMPGTARIPTAFELDLSYAGKVPDGRKVFEADGGCAACHSLGGTKKIGPDLSAIGAKYGKQALLDSIVNPSEAIGPEYVMTTFRLKSGDVVQGLIEEDAADRIVIRTDADHVQRVNPSDVSLRRQIRLSMMPEGLLSNLAAQQIADLLEFLSTLK